jgi:DNA-binding CsgD family transcriptional regulator
MMVTDELAESFLNQSQKLVLVSDQTSEATTDLHALRELFGLTVAEARLAAIIGRGASPREAAEQLQITEATARTVLKTVLAKTGTNRQSQIAALLGSVGLRG